MRQQFIILFAFMASTALAQIDNRLHWYDGAITYEATNQEHNNVQMYGMDEGEEHEFILRYNKEINPNHQVYTIDNGPNHYVNAFGQGRTVRHRKAEGWDVLCFYDSGNHLRSVMSGESQWDAEKLNKARWINQMLGEYLIEQENGSRLSLHWSWESLNINQVVCPYEIITFNGRVTGFITIKSVDGATNAFEGTWEVVPTLRGFKLCSVDTATGSTPWEWERKGKEYELAESNPDVGRFFYASTTLLNDKWFRRFDQKTLRVMRNSILSRHGYVFQSPDLKEYFSNEPWYKPAESNDNIKLTFVEQLNLDLIKSVEDEKLRESFRFDYELIKADGEDFDSIVVRGYKDDDDTPCFECRHELVANVGQQSATDVQWVNDSEDINFDGFPDLQIFLWYNTVGQVAESYAAYLWTPQGYFKEVEGFSDLYNPQIDHENSTITANYRSDANERTFETYKWNGDKLVLVKTHKEKLFDE